MNQSVLQVFLTIRNTRKVRVAPIPLDKQHAFIHVEANLLGQRVRTRSVPAAPFSVFKENLFFETKFDSEVTLPAVKNMLKESNFEFELVQSFVDDSTTSGELVILGESKKPAYDYLFADSGLPAAGSDLNLAMNGANLAISLTTSWLPSVRHGSHHPKRVRETDEPQLESRIREDKRARSIDRQFAFDDTVVPATSVASIDSPSESPSPGMAQRAAMLYEKTTGDEPPAVDLFDVQHEYTAHNIGPARRVTVDEEEEEADFPVRKRETRRKLPRDMKSRSMYRAGKSVNEAFTSGAEPGFGGPFGGFTFAKDGKDDEAGFPVIDSAQLSSPPAHLLAHSRHPDCHACMVAELGDGPATRTRSRTRKVKRRPPRPQPAVPRSNAPLLGALSTVETQIDSLLKTHCRKRKAKDVPVDEPTPVHPRQEGKENDSWRFRARTTHVEKIEGTFESQRGIFERQLRKAQGKSWSESKRVIDKVRGNAGVTEAYVPESTKANPSYMPDLQLRYV